VEILVPNINYTSVNLCDGTSACNPACSFEFNGDLNADCAVNGSAWIISGSCNPNVCVSPNPEPVLIPYINYTSLNYSCHWNSVCDPACDWGYTLDGFNAFCAEDGSHWIIAGSCIPNVCSAPEAGSLVPHINYTTVNICNGISDCDPGCQLGFTAEGVNAVCYVDGSVWDISGRCNPNFCFSPAEGPDAEALMPYINYTSLNYSCHGTSRCNAVCDWGYTLDGFNAVCAVNESYWDISGSCIPNVCSAPETGSLVPHINFTTVNICSGTSICDPVCNVGSSADGLNAVCYVDGSVWDISGICIPNVCGTPTAPELKTFVQNIDLTTVNICAGTSECYPECNSEYTADNLHAFCFSPGSVWDISGTCIPNECEAPTKNEVKKLIPNIDYTTVGSCDMNYECEPTCSSGFHEDDLEAVCIEFYSIWKINGRCFANVCSAPTKAEAENRVPSIDYSAVYNCDGESKCELKCA